MVKVPTNETSQVERLTVSNKTIGYLLVVLGIVLALASLFADTMGFGGMPGVFGWKQTLGVVAGLVGIVTGTSLIRREPPPAD